MFGGANWSERTWTPNDDYTIHQHAQPFIKLHGSTNWKGDGANAELMILGGGKVEAIQAIPVLRWYHEYFAQCLRQAGTRLTIIGYGFGDDHINTILKDCVQNRGVKMYVIDPRGAGLAYDMRGFLPGQVGAPAVTEFEEWFQRGLYSASTIPFRRLLVDESIDIGVLNQFLAGR